MLIYTYTIFSVGYGLFMNYQNVCSEHVRTQRGDRGPDPPKKNKNIGFLSNTGLDLLKISKLPSQHSMLGHHRHASETFRWRAGDGPLIVVLGSSLPSSTKNKTKKRCQSWTPSDKTFWIHACSVLCLLVQVGSTQKKHPG